MTTLNTQTINSGGLAVNYTAASAGGDKVSLAAANTFIHVKNGAASSITVTVPAQNNKYRGRTIPDTVVTIPASSDKMIGPFDSTIDGDVNGMATINYSAVATVTVAAVRI
jgi:hypothetical protein